MDNFNRLEQNRIVEKAYQICLKSTPFGDEIIHRFFYIKYQDS